METGSPEACREIECSRDTVAYRSPAIRVILELRCGHALEDAVAVSAAQQYKLPALLYGAVHRCLDEVYAFLRHKPADHSYKRLVWVNVQPQTLDVQGRGTE